MSDKLDRPITFDGPRTAWFADPSLSRIFSGHEYGHRCVAAIGPADFSRVAFAVTSNPRQKARELEKVAGSALIVLECAWSPARTAERVHAEVVALLAKANRSEVDGFVTIPRTYLRPLLGQAASKAGVPVLFHDDFHAKALGTETLKLRARLSKAEVDPKVVAASRYV